MRKETEVQAVRIEQTCENCKDGMMEIPRERSTMAPPGEHLHECTKCKHTEHFTAIYPRIEYREKDEEPGRVSDLPTQRCKATSHHGYRCALALDHLARDHQALNDSGSVVLWPK